MRDKQIAVFLDRDGVLIHDVHYLSSLDDIRFYPDISDGLKILRDCGYLLIVVTNQSGVARGFFPKTFVVECHNRMNQMLETDQAKLDHLYFCPHHINGLPPYNIKCDCRKPAPGMIRQAEKELNLNLQASFLIGDKKSDVESALSVNMTGILLTTGQGKQFSQTVAQDYPSTPILPSFSQAVAHITGSAGECRNQ